MGLDERDWSSGRMSRRAALLHSANGVALLCSLRDARHLRPTGRLTAAARASQRALPFAPFQADLPIPKVATPTRRTRTADHYDLTMRPLVMEILPGYQTSLHGYDARFPGPTIHARTGREIHVRHTNALDHETNVHLHGGVTPAGSDGHPKDGIAPGASRTYRYPGRQAAATLWYHDHVHGHQAQSVHHGLAGFHLLRDEHELSLELPSGHRDVPLMIQDRSFDTNGNFLYQARLQEGLLGDTILVNGAIAPRLRVERGLYRLRLLNGSNARRYDLVLGNRRSMTQIASDGGLLERPLACRSVGLSPAERVDVVVDFRHFGAGSTVTLHNDLGRGSTSTVMRFDVGHGTTEGAHVPAVLREPDGATKVTRKRRFTLELDTSREEVAWTINGRPFEMDRVDVTPRLNTAELWRFENRSDTWHPMHLHGAHFHVLSIAGRRAVRADRLGWKDTVAVPPHAAAEVRPRFLAYEGRYVFHCHLLEHGDMAMMGQMEVLA